MREPRKRQNIPYMDKPPALGGKLTYLTPAEFKEKFDCVYFEGIRVENSPVVFKKEDFIDYPGVMAVLERLRNPLEGLVICDMGKWGHGLFTTKEIPLGTVIGLYSGEVSKNVQSHYNCENIDAERYGGFSRFMQHLPASLETSLRYWDRVASDSRLLSINENMSLEEARRQVGNQQWVAAQKKEYAKDSVGNPHDFDDIRFLNPNTIKTVAETNVYYIPYRHYLHKSDVLIDIIVMIAKRDINADEIIGFSYGTPYWQNRMPPQIPVLFDKKGSLINQKEYQYKFGGPISNSLSSIMSDAGSYFEFLKATKLRSKRLASQCVKAFKDEKFVRAGKLAKQALDYLLQLNEGDVENELSSTYYNLGSALLPQKKFEEARQFLEKAKILSIKLGNRDRLLKVEEKLDASKKYERAMPLTFFDLRRDIILNLFKYLSLADLSRFARVSSCAQTFVRDSELWRARLLKDFTENPLPPTKMSYYLQYKRIFRATKSLDKSGLNPLIKALGNGDEITAKKLISADTVFDRKSVLKILKNKNMLEFALKNGLDANKILQDPDERSLVSIIHVAAFKAPELLSLILNSQDSITILPELHLAIVRNDTRKIDVFLKNFSEIDQEDACEFTPLFWALLMNNCSVASQLISKGAKIENLKRRRSCFTDNICVHLIRNNQVACLELLLKNELSPNAFAFYKGSLKTLLSIAAAEGKIDILDLLIQYDALIYMDIKYAGKLLKNNSSFGMATNSVFGMDVNFKLNSVAVAVSRNQMVSLKYLIKFVVNAINQPTMTWFFQDFRETFVHFYPLLVEAVSHLAEEAVEFLLLSGADPNKKGTWWNSGKPSEVSTTIHKTPLEFLFRDVFYNLKNDDSPLRIFNLLLKYGADIQPHADEIFTLMKPSKTRKQSFILSIFRILMRYRFDFNQRDKAGMTLLHHAVKEDLFEVVCCLIEEVKVEVNIKDEEGNTPIFLAAKACNEDIFKYLQKKGASVDEQNAENQTPLQVISASFLNRLSL